MEAFAFGGFFSFASQAFTRGGGEEETPKFNETSKNGTLTIFVDPSDSDFLAACDYIEAEGTHYYEGGPQLVISHTGFATADTYKLQLKMPATGHYLTIAPEEVKDTSVSLRDKCRYVAYKKIDFSFDNKSVDPVELIVSVAQNGLRLEFKRTYVGFVKALGGLESQVGLPTSMAMAEVSCRMKQLLEFVRCWRSNLEGRRNCMTIFKWSTPCAQLAEYGELKFCSIPYESRALCQLDETTEIEEAVCAHWHAPATGDLPPWRQPRGLGMTIYGKFGVGKSYLTTRLAALLPAKLVIFDQSHHEYWEKLVDMVRLHMGSRSKFVCQFDEMDKFVLVDGASTVPHAIGGGTLRPLMLSTLLSLIDRLLATPNVVVIGTANDITKIHPAILRSGRLGDRMFPMKPLSKDIALKVVHNWLKPSLTEMQWSAIDDEEFKSSFPGPNVGVTISEFVTFVRQHGGDSVSSLATLLRREQGPPAISFGEKLEKWLQSQRIRPHIESLQFFIGPDDDSFAEICDFIEDEGVALGIKRSTSLSISPTPYATAVVFKLFLTLKQTPGLGAHFIIDPPIVGDSGVSLQDEARFVPYRILKFGEHPVVVSLSREMIRFEFEPPWFTSEEDAQKLLCTQLSEWRSKLNKRREPGGFKVFMRASKYLTTSADGTPFYTMVPCEGYTLSCMSQVKAALDSLWPKITPKNRLWASHCGLGMAFFGVHGTGKSFLVNNIAASYAATVHPFTEISRAHWNDMLRRVTTQCKLSKCICLFDNLALLSGDAASLSEVSSVVDSLVVLPNVLLITTAINSDGIERTLLQPGRFGLQYILPSLSAPDAQKIVEGWISMLAKPPNCVSFAEFPCDINLTIAEFVAFFQCRKSLKMLSHPAWGEQLKSWTLARRESLIGAASEHTEVLFPSCDSDDDFDMDDGSIPLPLESYDVPAYPQPNSIQLPDPGSLSSTENGPTPLTVALPSMTSISPLASSSGVQSQLHETEVISQAPLSNTSITHVNYGLPLEFSHASVPHLLASGNYFVRTHDGMAWDIPWFPHDHGLLGQKPTYICVWGRAHGGKNQVFVVIHGPSGGIYIRPWCCRSTYYVGVSNGSVFLTDYPFLWSLSNGQNGFRVHVYGGTPSCCIYVNTTSMVAFLAVGPPSESSTQEFEFNITAAPPS